MAHIPTGESFEIMPEISMAQRTMVAPLTPEHYSGSVVPARRPCSTASTEQPTEHIRAQVLRSTLQETSVERQTKAAPTRKVRSSNWLRLAASSCCTPSQEVCKVQTLRQALSSEPLDTFTVQPPKAAISIMTGPYSK